MFYYVRNFEILAILSIIIAVLNFYPGFIFKPEIIGLILILFFLVTFFYFGNIINTFYFPGKKLYSTSEEGIGIKNLRKRIVNSKIIRKELDRDIQYLSKFLPYLLKKKYYFSEEEQKLSLDEL